MGKKYHLTNDLKQNARILSDYHYVFGDALISQILQGVYVMTESTASDEATRVETSRKVDTHIHGIYLLHSVDEIKSSVGLSSEKMKAVLERLFRKAATGAKKLCSLDTKEFYAFIINNAKLLKAEFAEVSAEMVKQITMVVNPKTSTFRIPEQDFFKYDSTVKREVDYLSNAYEGYTSGFITSRIRSNSEQLFEQYCERNNNVDWVYKNGDSGQQYFSIVYLDGLRKQWLFYPDYILKMKDGTVWIIETKGGESHGESKNRDVQIGNKFNAFKAYASRHGLKWGFVRDLDNQLYINNTDYVSSMSDERWESIQDLF